MNVELRALEANGTWEITTLPEGKKAIGSKWLYKTKYNSDGTFERCKVRFVIQGCRQRKGIHYDETFAPMAKMLTVRALLAVAAIKDWNISQMDVTNALLHGDLYDKVYMQLPKGYRGPGVPIEPSQGEIPSATGTKSPLVCKLVKSLYGLKQAPRQWFNKLSSALLSFGFQQFAPDPSLFIKKNLHSFTTLLVYVDDMVIVGTISKK